MPSAGGSPAPGRARINPIIDRLGVTAWRLVGMGIVFVAAVWLLTRLWVIVLAVAIATLFARAMNPVAVWLRDKGMKPALVAVTVMLGFTLVMAGIIAALVPPIRNSFEDLGPTIEQSIDDLEDWLVDDSPFDVSRQDIRDFREDARDRVGDAFSSSEASVVSGTMVAFEVITALVLSLITTFFILKDGERFGRWLTEFVPDRHQPLSVRLARKAWWTLGGYLKGAAILGVVEGTIMAVTVWLAGGTLAVPVGVITFFAAFVPFAGAVVAGTIAVLVTLVTGGVTGALIVLVVAIVVQQLDNDILAPFIYGKGLELHPLVVLFALAGGSALMGPVGALFAVPVSAVTINVIAEARQAHRDGEVAELAGENGGAAGASGDGAEVSDANASADDDASPPGVGDHTAGPA